jgi:hypothetical protein
MERTRGLAHLKTAGTSYLESLRTVSKINKELIKEIYMFALEHFEADKQSYLISAQVSKAPFPDKITDWTRLVDQFDAREILHVTYGSVVTAKCGDEKELFRQRLMSILQENRELYFCHLQKHFMRHLAPFTMSKS